MSINRRWAAGDEYWSKEGLHLRVVEGAKPVNGNGEGRDLRLEVDVNGQWTAVHMELGFALADFFYENEEVLFPPPQYKGGEKYLEQVQNAARFGYLAAQEWLERESRRKRDAARLQAGQGALF